MLPVQAIVAGLILCLPPVLGPHEVQPESDTNPPLSCAPPAIDRELEDTDDNTGVQRIEISDFRFRRDGDGPINRVQRVPANELFQLLIVPMAESYEDEIQQIDPTLPGSSDPFIFRPNDQMTIVQPLGSTPPARMRVFVCDEFGVVDEKIMDVHAQILAISDE